MLPLILDRSVRSIRGGQVLAGGDPPRVLKLTMAGRDALRRFASTGAAENPGERALARRVTDAGLMHPCAGHADVPAALATVVIPVLDRPAQLERCLAALRGSHCDQQVIVADDGSREPIAIAEICQRFGARVVRLEQTSGPATARNTAAAAAATPLIAFLDSDCVAGADWIQRLVGHFSDPLVAAVAPRIVGLTEESDGAVARFAAAHTSLDLGAYPARVIPGGRVSYVPSAALLVRRAALGTGFDPGLRYGEDVDLIWRMHDAGWRIRYDPSVIVRHVEPPSWTRLIKRKFRYGTSAGPLAARHPGRVPPLVVRPWSAAVVAAGLAGHPLAAVTIGAAQTMVTAQRVSKVEVPLSLSVRWPISGAAHTLLGTGQAATTFVPWALVAGVASKRTRWSAILLVTLPPLVEWSRRKPPLDIARWTALSVADNIAYGAGVWVGAAHTRSWGPLAPRLARTRHG